MNHLLRHSPATACASLALAPAAVGAPVPSANRELP
jgi:hypothetical protein